MSELDNFTTIIFSEDYKIQERLDYLYETIDELLLEERFEAVDTTLLAIKEGYIEKCVENPSIAVGLLAVTLGATNRLQNRRELADLLYQKFHEEEDIQEEKLLSGLIRMGKNDL